MIVIKSTYKSLSFLKTKALGSNTGAGGALVTI